MSSKRGANSISEGASKKAKIDTETIDLKKVVELMKKYESERKRNIAVDSTCPYAYYATVVEQYDCALNQTDIATNSNEFFKLQLIQTGGMYYTWKRWGRVGCTSETSLQGFKSLKEAKSDFQKTFTSLTDNEWSDKDQFTINPGKYVIVDTTGYNTDKATKQDVNCERTLACKLDQATQNLIEIIFDESIFNTALRQMNIDVQKMPLGHLSKHQIGKGFEVLQEIEEVLTKKKKGSLKDLSSRFYTLIPHSSGVRRPVIISSKKQLRSKIEMLMTLGDIELAQEMQKTTLGEKGEAEAVPHPYDEKYEKLQCDLQLLDKSSKDFKMIWKYFHATVPESDTEILDIWAVDRHSEAERYKLHDEIESRLLLWHGTGIHAVASILNQGLRIMPSCCQDIYFATESSTSVGYAEPNSQNIGFMFLAEVALTEMDEEERMNKFYFENDGSDDENNDIETTLDGWTVTLPIGRKLSYYHIGEESRCRLRYLLEIKLLDDSY